jgi:hypothetical protein
MTAWRERTFLDRPSHAPARNLRDNGRIGTGFSLR